MTSVLFIIFTGVAVTRAADMKAEFDVNGYKGSVYFAKNYSDVNVSLSFDLNPPGSNVTDYDTVELWSLPALFGRTKPASEVCSGEIGVKSRDLITNGEGQSKMVASLPLSDYFHRSVVVRSSTNTTLPILCGTILSQYNEVTSYRAKFMGPVFGSLWFRHDATVGAFVYGDLVEISSTATVNRTLVLHQTGSINFESSYDSRCSGLTGSGTTINDSLTISNTTTVSSTMGFLYSSQSMTSYNGTVLAIMNGPNVVACATLRPVSSKKVTSTINWQGIKGSFTFSQESPFDVTVTNVDVFGLDNRVSGYHIHKYPVPQRLSEAEYPCDGKYVSGHFNPYGVIASNSPPSGTGSTDEYEIGDLSGKYRTLDGKNSLKSSYRDWNLPLFGPNSVVGRSIVIHRSDQSGSRLLCSTIGFPSDVTTAVAIFKSPVYGTMYFRQETNDHDADTMIFLELASTTKAPSESHNWHVHEYPADDDAYLATGTCSSAGGHYNPSQVNVASPYSTECNGANPFRCELGDLSGRLGAINVAATRPTEAGKFFFTDEYSPLSGPYSVLGKSITVHGANKAAGRFACANITQLHPVVVMTTGPWVGTSGGNAKGLLTMKQASEFDITKVEGNLTDLNKLASGYHIHVFSIPPDALSGSECSADSVAGHYMPFNWNKTQSPGAGVGTNDKYEVGDLSGKYGLLDGKTEKQITTVDTNLPLFTSLSSADRSIVIHKKENSQRWKCANLFSTPPSDSNGYVVSATVTFTTSVTGTIKLRQIVYEDAGAGLTSFDVDVRPKNRGQSTLQHKWHIHVDPVTDQTKCGDAAGHFDPYDAISNKDYSSDCGSQNPLYCEVGDTSAKQGLYDIGGGRKLYHDVDSPLHTNYTILGRSIVFHESNGGSARFTCANIIPDKYTYTFAFPSKNTFNRYDFTEAIAKSLGIARLRVIVLYNVDVPVVRSGCSKVMVTIAGGESLTESQLGQLDSGELEGLGIYSSTPSCVTATGATVIGKQSSGVVPAASLWTFLFAFLVTLTVKIL